MFENYLSEYGPSVVGGAFFLLAAVIFAILLDRGLRHVMITRAKMDPAIATILARTLRLTIWVLAGVAVLEEVGIEVSSLIAALGIFGFAVAIGMRTTTTNFFTGIMLLILKPYKVREYVSGASVEGVVESMSVFHTVIITDDGTYAAVPNGAMWSRAVKNLSRQRPQRFDLRIKVGRSIPFEEYSSVLDQTFSAEIALSKDFRPLIRIEEVTEKDLTVLTSVWCRAHHSWDVLQGLITALTEDLTKAGVEVILIGKAEKESPPPKRKKTAKSSDSAAAAAAEGDV